MPDLKILVEKPTESTLKGLNVFSFGLWTKEPSTNIIFKTPFETVSIGKGDLVTFPQGLSCTWQVKKAVRKHYKFG